MELIFYLQVKSLQLTWLSLQWLHNERDWVSNHQRLDCLLSRLFRRRSKKNSKLHVTGLCAGNSPVTGEFPAQRASNGKKISVWWRHHARSSNERRRRDCITGYKIAFPAMAELHVPLLSLTHKQEMCNFPLSHKMCVNRSEDMYHLMILCFIKVLGVSYATDKRMTQL